MTRVIYVVTKGHYESVVIVKYHYESVNIVVKGSCENIIIVVRSPYEAQSPCVTLVLLQPGNR